MAVEYAISAGEGTLLDYGVASFVGQSDEDRHSRYRRRREVCVIDYEDERNVIFEEIKKGRRLKPKTVVTVMSADCPDDCETGR